MRVNIAQTTPPSLSPSSSSSSYPLSTRFFLLHRSRSSIFGSSLNLSSPKSTAHNLRRSCSASFDGYDFPHQFDHLTHKTNTHFQKQSFNSNTTSFLHPGSNVELLEPSFLGIKPEPPDWPARDELIRESIARRASSIELPLSLRMIKMKQRFQKLEDDREVEKDVNFSDPVSKLCCSTLYIVKEIQKEALKIRGLILDGVLDGVVSKVQKEMTSSFVWLFREVFAKTPDLMVQVMLLTSDFGVHSLERCQLVEKPEPEVGIEEGLDLGGSGYVKRDIMEGMSDNEVGLWNSIVDEANRMGGSDWKDAGVGFVVVDEDDHDDGDDSGDDQLGLIEKKFVSPVKVEIEDDDYEEYYRTDLLYQMGLSQEPNNTLLLFNYAQFLCLVSRDYDRAEECLKRAIQLDPTDAEVISQYANFLWQVRKDLLGAEERFQQAIAAEPYNSYHASKYASFLWSTGGEDTCYPLDPPT